VILKQRRVFSPAQNFLNFFLDDLKCKFDFYAFSDQDDIWLPNKLIEAINCLKRNNANCYSSNLLVFHENDSKYKFSCLNKSSNQKEFDYLFQSASAGCTYVFDFSAYKILQEVISKYGVQKQIISHDWFVYAVCRSYRLNWIMDKKSYILYRQHNGNVYGSSNFISDLAKKIRIIRKKKYLNSFFSLRQYLCQSKGENEIFNAVISEKISDKIVLFLNFSKYRRKKIDAFVLLIILLFRKK
jgi:rhamnosyltransferase